MAAFGSPLWGKVEWGQPTVNPSIQSGLDILNCILDLWYRLGFASYNDLNQANRWLSIAELYQWGDDAAKRLAYDAGVFVVYDTTVPVTGGTAVYTLPATHVFTLLAMVVYNAAPIQLLRLTAVRDLWALDATWNATTGAPVRASMDAGSVGTI